MLSSYRGNYHFWFCCRSKTSRANGTHSFAIVKAPVRCYWNSFREWKPQTRPHFQIGLWLQYRHSINKNNRICEWRWHVHFIASTTATSFCSFATKKTAIWHNPKRMPYKKNTTMSQEEIQYTEEQICELQQTQITTANKVIYIKHEMVLNCDRWNDLKCYYVYVICADLLYLQY
jgi:hypothetical protein